MITLLNFSMTVTVFPHYSSFPFPLNLLNCNYTRLHQASIHPKYPSQPVCWGCGNTTAGHQPSHQDEPGGAVVEWVLAITEDVRALLGASIWAGVVHKCFVVYQVRHLALALIRHLCDLRVGGGKGGRRRAVGQALVDTTVEDGGAGGGGVGRLAKAAKMKEK